MGSEKARPVHTQVPALKERLRSAIYRGEIAVGARIVEDDLRRETGASLRAVRQALAELAREGLVERKRHAGTFVSPSVTAPASETLRKIHAVGILSSLPAKGFPKDGFAGGVLNGVKAALAAPATIEFFLNPDDGTRALDDTPAAPAAAKGDALQGVIGIETSNAKQLNEWARTFGPVVAVDFHAPDALFDAVTLDHREAGYQAAAHLLALGHRKVAFVGERFSRHSSDPTWQERLLGYVEALLAANVNPNVDWILETRRSSPKVASLLPAFHRAVQPTAYVLCTARMYPHARKALASLGLECPKDVSLACADGMLPVTEVPYVSCVRASLEGLGQAAVKMLASRLACRAMPPVRATLPVVFSPGGSSCNASA